MTTQLTITQQAVLNHAHEHTEGKIVWLPDTIKGGARQNVIDGLANRGLIESKHNDWLISPKGYEALGIPRRDHITLQALDAVIESATAPTSETTKTPRTRDNTKQAQVIAMLKRPEGATIAQICEITGWKSHTVRGTFAGTFKKRLGFGIASIKEPGADRVYKFAP